MRLSDAIALGRVLINNPDPESYCKCALGMANASIDGEAHEGFGGLEKATTRWPFLLNLYGDWPSELVRVRSFNGGPSCVESIISLWFYDVCRNHSTLEQLIDWVRSVEPAEQNSVDMSPVEEVEYASVT